MELFAQSQLNSFRKRRKLDPSTAWLGGGVAGENRWVSWLGGLALAFAFNCAPTACDPQGAPVRRARWGCPAGTKRVGSYCVSGADPCPEGFEWDAKLAACIFMCPDAAVVEPDAEPSPFCSGDAGAAADGGG
jgi:hypothetical protein